MIFVESVWIKEGAFASVELATAHVASELEERLPSYSVDEAIADETVTLVALDFQV